MKSLGAMEDRPNIFKFATKELSQDAFICWLLSWAMKKFDGKNSELSQCARKLVLSFLHKFECYHQIILDDVEDISNIWQQYQKIDVYLQVNIKRVGKVSFILEDKVHTSHHSDQLQRYQNIVEKDDIIESDILGIYFKTGFIYDEDKNLLESFRLFDRKDLLRVLETCKSDNFIFCDYLSYLREMDSKFESDIQMARDPDLENCSRALSEPHAQWALMEVICRRSPTSFLKADYGNEICVGDLKRGTSFGSPWTQYWFSQIALQSDEEKDVDSLFYRLDFQVPPKGTDAVPCLLVRNYNKSPSEQASGRPIALQQAHRLKRVGLYQRLFSKTLQALDNFALTHGEFMVDRKGDYESTIGGFYFDNETNRPEALIEHIPLFHEEFFKQLQGLGQMPQFYLSDLASPLRKMAQDLFLEISKNRDELRFFEKKLNDDLVELRVSSKSWSLTFGEDKLVVIAYQYQSHVQSRIGVRTLLSSQISENLIEKFKTACSESGLRTDIRQIADWQDWLRVFENDDYPDELYEETVSAEAVHERIRQELERLHQVCGRLSC